MGDVSRDFLSYMSSIPEDELVDSEGMQGGGSNNGRLTYSRVDVAEVT